jgi:hypothetical protein
MTAENINAYENYRTCKCTADHKEVLCVFALNFFTCENMEIQDLLCYFFERNALLDVMYLRM